ncbi:MAG: class I SAM-dependent methyltransferase [Dehalococcoidia bacterium]
MTEPPRATEERLAFDQVPEAYDRVRPTYPEPLFDELFAYVRADGPAAILEIGPGTGKATRSLLERGASVTAVEIGVHLAEFLRARLSPDFPGRLEVVNAPFEEADLRHNQFEAVVSATAFHWLDPAIRLQRCHDLLRPGGTLAIIDTNQIASDADSGFFDRTFPIYLRYRPDEPRSKTPGEDVVPKAFDEVQGSALFDDVTLHRYRWDQTYPTAAYADLVRSYANTQAMEPGPREALIADLCEVIDSEYDGFVVRPLVMTLTLGRRAKR